MENNSFGDESAGKKRRDLLLPASILVAAVLIAGSLVYSAGKRSSEKNLAQISSGNEEQTAGIENLVTVNSDDHIRGDMDAPVQVVEFSDMECPFCKTFHDTMQKVMLKYGDKVAWIYRHAPIDSLHPKSRKEAEATECAASLGGNIKFWAYLDRLMEITPSNNGLDPAELPRIAEYVGLDKAKFESCLSSGKYADKIQADLENAVRSGMIGTPYSIILINGKVRYSIPGGLNFEESRPGEPYMDQIISELIEESGQ
ncbi:hypothetical protein A3D55_02070 [Candidatus Jorgensenbacteria bacterium RIFCSPHIGHO2_02_FULL_45_20]|uniref:Thioredoxin domain-containing protein n=2 Tax=Candidatus Joergenseniibacteriota TaxID=1752739 RepID=A0A1F6BN11_9BACT|nr:MAG: hypothetical protein A3D55_02070 [Candidatus Jorgensenbacteria bacterium RIFCSPHIGHO2_02_FULL_45_20]